MQKAFFLFHKTLNDFLRQPQRQQWLEYAYRTPSTVKDAMEALGVPHVEVETIFVNNINVGFDYLLKMDDRIEIFPFEKFPVGEEPVRFVLDVHLGKLARLLRMLGFDTLYQNHWSDHEIVAIAAAENRMVLTRDIGLLKHKILQHGYWLRSQDPEQQLLEVIRYFSLCAAIRPFTRCLACNGQLTTVNKTEVLPRLLPQTRAVFDAFYQCDSCKNVYWKGSHYEKMQRLIDRITSLACH